MSLTGVTGVAMSMGGSVTGQSINLELGQSATAQIGLNDTNVRALAGITGPATQISLYDFYGKSSATVYHTWTGGADGFDYDNSYGDITTGTTIYGTTPVGGSPANFRAETIQNTTSRTGMTSVTVNLRAVWTIGVGVGGDPPGPVTGSVFAQFSWDGTSWYDLMSPSSTDNSSTAEQSYSISNTTFTSSTNLNTLRIAFICNGGGTYDEFKGIWESSIPAGSMTIYDVAVTVS